ncbi:MAG: 16S rRNA (guanine(966)-N(2))-methyltransferase RsmD [Iamia sp.]
MSMRVVAGTARGLRLMAPEGRGTRPTTERVREATFNALGSLGAVEGARVLDAFAGSGALGIEALSRGAAHCTFVDADRVARAAVEANLATTRLAEGAKVVNGDAATFLARSEDRWDLVLLDPPHAGTDWAALLGVVAGALAPDALVVAESDRTVIDEAEGDGTWSVLREKRYGGTVVQMISARPTSESAP